MGTLRRPMVALLVVAVLAGLVTLVGARPAAACSCVGWSDAEAVTYADAVFSGKVVDVAPSESAAAMVAERTYAVRVAETLKGEPDPVQAVRTPGSSASCGVDLAVGDRVLVFASGGGGGLVEPRRGEMTTSLCSGTRPLEGPVPDSVRDAAAGAAVDCASAIDALDRSPDGFRRVAGVVAIPVDTVHEIDASVGPPHFAKIPLAVQPGAVARIVVHQPRRGPVTVQLGGTAPAGTVRVADCVAAGGARWLVFAGGIWVDRPTCVRLEVVAKRTRTVRVPVGRACSDR